jgi:hypothetical protein
MEDVDSLEPGEYERLRENIAADLQPNIKHDPVEAPRCALPFKDPNVMAIFVSTLRQVRHARHIPGGLGLRPDEWEEGRYPTEEVLRFGRRRQELVVSLPENPWFLRALAWGQALDVMSHIMLVLEN